MFIQKRVDEKRITNISDILILSKNKHFLYAFILKFILIFSVFTHTHLLTCLMINKIEESYFKITYYLSIYYYYLYKLNIISYF